MTLALDWVRRRQRALAKGVLVLFCLAWLQAAVTPCAMADELRPAASHPAAPAAALSLLLILLVAATCFANPPFAPNVRVSDDAGGQVINQGESDFTVWHGQSIYSCCNLAERSTISSISSGR